MTTLLTPHLPSVFTVTKARTGGQPYTRTVGIRQVHWRDTVLSVKDCTARAEAVEANAIIDHAA